MNKKTEKAPSVATTTADKAPTKKVAETKTAKVSENGMVEVVVCVAKFGTYKKGKVLSMRASTARGCIANGVVKYK